MTIGSRELEWLEPQAKQGRFTEFRRLTTRRGPPARAEPTVESLLTTSPMKGRTGRLWAVSLSRSK